MTLIKRLAKDSVIYGVGGMLSKGLTFLFLPIYTRIFSQAEYGLIEMAVVAGLLLETLITMGLDSAQSFFFFEPAAEQEPEERGRIVSAIFAWNVLWGAVVLCLFTLAASFLNTHFFGGRMRGMFLVCFLFSVGANLLMGHAAQVCRLLHRPWGYVTLNLVSGIGAGAFCLLFAMVGRWGVISYFVGIAIGSAASAFLGWYSFRHFLKWKPSILRMWPKLLKFGIAFVPSAIGYYLISSSDRWVIASYLGTEQVGIYAAAVRIALVVSLVVSSFRLAWWPIAMELINQPDGGAVIKMVSESYLLGGVAITALLGVLGRPLLYVLTPPAFHAAAPLVGLLTWGSILFGAFLLVSLGIWKSRQTHWSPILMLLSAGVYYALAITLIPRVGIAGAALASALGSGLWIATTLLVSEWLWPIGYSPFRMLGLLGMGSLAGAWPLLVRSWMATTLGIATFMIAIGIFLIRMGSWRGNESSHDRRSAPAVY